MHDEYRRWHDRDCALTGGNLYADTMFILWRPLANTIIRLNDKGVIHGGKDKFIPKLLSWMNKLPYYYETATQIFAHAGVDEEIPEEEMEYCILGTPEYVMTGKFPPTIGKFYKDIIEGHVSASTAASYAGHIEDRDFQGIFYDGYSHYYIDGSVECRGNLLCLVYDEEQGKYYELKSDGSLELIKNPVRDGAI